MKIQCDKCTYMAHKADSGDTIKDFGKHYKSVHNLQYAGWNANGQKAADSKAILAHRPGRYKR